MKFLSVDLTNLKKPEFIGSEPVARATWLCLLGYCGEQENSGVIKDCAGWGDRQWMQTCGVTKDEVQQDCSLYKWEGSDLVIWAYPVCIQEQLEKKREAGKKGGKASGEARKKKQKGSSASTGNEAETKQKGSSASSTNETPVERKSKSKSKSKVKVRVKEVPPKVPQGGLSEEEQLELDGSFSGTDPADPDPFQTFWKLYPRKVGKPKAAKAFNSALKRVDLVTLLDRLRAWAASAEWRRDNGQFIPHPTTWLNRDGWEDELTIETELENDLTDGF